MKNKIHSKGRYIFMVAAVAIMITGCSKDIAFLSSSVVPSAEGEVSVKMGDNNNYEIDLYVDRLAEPDRLTPPQSVYVVWMETSRNGVINLGQLETSTKFMSKVLSSSLKTVTPYKPTSFYITAEQEASGSYPGNMIVLRTGQVVIK